MSAEGDFLRRGKARIAKPAQWTQHEEARNEHGEPRRPMSPKACAWCVEGALFAERPKAMAIPELRFLHRAAEELTGNPKICASEYNDEPGRTHAEILALYDRAAELADAAEGAW